MRQTAFILAGLVSAASIALVGCDVHKTQEGKVDLPKYEVSKTQEGNVQMPKYDVDAPKVGVYTEKETLTVPKVNVTPAKDVDDNKTAEKK